jgi:UDP-N-acetylglucosamine diphosphorylase/glucosamine-1-phosphate N-acetyltransferase
MRSCVFEDYRVDHLDPLTLTRPAFDLWCGASTLLARQQRWLGPGEMGAWVRPYLSEYCRFTHPDLPVNDADWLCRGRTTFVNSRWLPPLPSRTEAMDGSTPRIGMVDQQVAYVVGATPGDCFPNHLDQWLESCRQTLPAVQAGGTMLDYLWDFVDENSQALIRDWSWFQGRVSDPRPRSGLTILGPAEKVVVADDVEIEPFVLIDTRNGPVLIDRGAVVRSFSRLEGPCYIGRESQVLGAKLRGGTIGPCCRIGGEVEASILQGYSNKYHDGFLGHSYVGEWVNLAAGTQTSDLRNDYGTIRVHVDGFRISTGRNKVGSFVGDHTKTGLGSLLNTGTVIGIFCNVLPSESLAPTVIPSFCQFFHGQLRACSDLRQLFQTAAMAMRRRGHELKDAHKDFFSQLFEYTSSSRQAINHR